MPAYLIFILLLIIVLLLVFLHSARPSLRVLMYHKVAAENKDRLTVTKSQLHEQLTWLQKKNYNIISFKEFNQIEKEKKKGRFVILTFDDAYENNLQYALPVLEKTKTKASIFIPTSFIGKINEWDRGSEKIMTVAQLQQLPTGIIEFGLHTHTHKNFKNSSSEEIKSEMQQSIQTLRDDNIPFVPVFAYAYGAFSKQADEQQNMFKVFSDIGIWYALRIGNNINYLPIKNKFLINRIDIRGTDSFFIFKMKVLFGKTKL